MELVLARDIPFWSICEHDLLPFTGTAQVGYLPGDQILGLGKLGLVVELFASLPSVEDRLTQQVAIWLRDQLTPGGELVLEAEHTCMTLSGVRANGSVPVTSAMRGLLVTRAAPARSSWPWPPSANRRPSALSFAVPRQSRDDRAAPPAFA